jgi:hypothetical protein
MMITSADPTLDHDAGSRRLITVPDHGAASPRPTA